MKWPYKYATVQFLLVGFELMFRAIWRGQNPFIVWVVAFMLCFPKEATTNKEKEDE